MIDFIPLEFYAKVFFNFMLFITILTFIQSNITTIQSENNLSVKTLTGNILFVILIVYVGFRPISGMYFGDMGRYAKAFVEYSNGANVTRTKDVLFEYFVKFCSGFMSVNFYFLTCAILYIAPFYFVSKKFFNKFWFYSFLIFIASFTFWGSAANGIRNGIAASFFLVAISLNSKLLKYFWILMAISFHSSLTIPSIAYFITDFYRKTKNYLLFWLLSIPLSFIAGGFFQNFFLNLGFGNEDKLEGYLTKLDAGIQNAKVGFRWDFIFYSAIGVYAGWYYIFKKKYNDKIYIQIFNIYLIANAFWILIIRANFSNRFAYLSWFLLPLVVIYPLLKKEFFNNQHLVVGTIIFGYYLFTYLLNVILI